MKVHYFIRPAVLSDLDLASITAFNQAMALETENLALDPQTITAGVAAVLTDPSKGKYFLAIANKEEKDSEIIGCSMITFEWSDWRNANIWWLQSVYVRPEYRKQGVFSLLFKFIQQQAAANGAVMLRLYAEINNTPAHTVYRKVGMTDGHYIVFESGVIK
jgi:GNAT superfamily N-acetyltransferase